MYLYIHMCTCTCMCVICMYVYVPIWVCDTCVCPHTCMLVWCVCVCACVGQRWTLGVILQGAFSHYPPFFWSRVFCWIGTILLGWFPHESQQFIFLAHTTIFSFKQTNKQANKWTNKWTNKETSKQMNKQTWIIKIKFWPFPILVLQAVDWLSHLPSPVCYSLECCNPLT